MNAVIWSWRIKWNKNVSCSAIGVVLYSIFIHEIVIHLQWFTPVNSIYLPGAITFSHLAVKKWSLAWATREQWRELSTPFPRQIVRQFQSPYTPSPRGLSRISSRQVALALASRFSRMLSFQINKRDGVHWFTQVLLLFNVYINIWYWTVFSGEPICNQANK
jgi:hypothetical protein